MNNGIRAHRAPEQALFLQLFLEFVVIGKADHFDDNVDIQRRAYRDDLLIGNEERRNTPADEYHVINQFPANAPPDMAACLLEAA